MQLWQQNMTYKQLQELQRQQQLHQIGEERQQNSSNQHSAAAQQAGGGPLPPFINGTPVRDASHMFMNSMQRGSSPSLQGLPNGQAFSQDRNQTMHSMGLSPQQFNSSLHGTLVGSAGGNGSQYSNLKGMSRDSVNFLSHSGGGNGSQMPITHSSTFSNSFHGDHGISSDNVNTSGGGFLSRQGFQMRNVSGQGPPQNENFLQMNSSLPELNGRQDLTGNSEIMHRSTAQLGTSQSLVPLDPLEQKILYNMDDSGWDSGFGRSLDMGAGSFGSAMEQSDFSSAFQSGSWSALMQSAVEEASNSDTGVQEKSSGLTFQNTELSTNNQPPKFMNEERRQTGWADNNLESASSNSKSFPMLNDSSMRSNFPGFQQSDFQSSTQQGDREGLRQYVSNESFQKSPKNGGEWLDCNPRQSNQISQQTQPLKHLENAWAGHNYEHSGSDEQQRRMASHNNIGQQFGKQKGGVNGAMYKERDLWPGRTEQLNSPSNNPMRKDSQAHHFGSEQNTFTTKAQLEVDKRTRENHDYMKHPMKNYENDSGGKTQDQRRTSPQTLGNSYEGANKSFENFNDSYNSKGFSGPKQGLDGQFSMIGNNSKKATLSDKGQFPNFQGKSEVLDDAAYGGDLGSNTSTSFGQTVGSDRQNVALQTSVHMLDLLHKVDQSSEDGPMSHLGSTEHNSLFETPKANTHVDQFNPSSASHGFGLKLAPPSQRLPNSNRFPPAQDLSQIPSNLHPRQVNSESGLKNQGWLDSASSVRSLPPNEFSQRTEWDDKSTNLGQTNASSYMNMHVNSDATLTSGSSHFRNQPQGQHMPNALVTGESSQGTQAGTSSRFRPFNPVSSQGTSQQTPTNPGQPFPILETTSLSQPSVISSMPQKGGMLATHQNAWKNVPASRFASANSSMNPSKNSIEDTSWSSQGINDQNSQRGRMVSPDLGASSMNSQGSEYGEEQLGKQKSRHEISSEIQDSSHSGGFSEGQETVQKHIPAHSNQKDSDSLHGDNNGSAASERNIESFGRSLKASQTLHQNFNLLHQMQAMKNSRETDLSKKYGEADDVTNVQQVSHSVGQQSVSEHDLKSRNYTHIGPNSLQPGSFPSGDAKMLNFLSNAREELSGKSLSQHASQPSPGSGLFNQNGQMLPNYDARPANTAMEQFSADKPSQNMPLNSSVDQIGTAISRQVESILPSQTTSLVASENLTAPCVLPSDLANQSGANMLIKKRKTLKSEPIPWHVEVTQGSRRLQDISMAEQDWARATNHLVEKVEDDIEFIGEGHQMHHRSKRRLIQTTQLIQQLLRPAPASILLGDARTRCDSVAYFVAKLALADACGLTNCSRNELHSASDNGDMTSEKHASFKSDKHIKNLMEGFAERTKKLENDFSRLESSSILDIRLDYQDLERNSVMNRFAKFHMRGQPTTSQSGTPMPALKPAPQRYVTAFPMPRDLPEGAQCFSL